MLQIITGKFFKKEERHKSNRKAVFFSNYGCICPIETCIGTLEPVDIHTITTWVFSYVNQREKEGGNFEIVSSGDDEIVEQFRRLAIFGLRAYFASQRHEVEHYCRQTKISITDDSIPSQMLDRYFTVGLRGYNEDPESFQKLVEKTLSLKRERYLATMAALGTFCSALEATSTSLDLAYSMLIYVLESLAHGFDGYEPTWGDYEHNVRKPLDSVLASIPVETSLRIRTALLKSSHLRLMKRFLCFVETHTDDSYFIRGAEGIDGAIRKSEFARALKNAYRIRSGYVHELKPIVSQLRIPAISRQDAFRWRQEPYFTVSGLVRLISHVLNNFIERGESMIHEDVNWRAQLPGIVTLNMAPQYWIHDAASFSPEEANHRYRAFLEHLAANIRLKKPLLDLTSLMETIERYLNEANDRQKTAMLCLYVVCNFYRPVELRRPNWERVLKDYETLLDTCCIETFSARLAIGANLEWDFQACSQCFEEYDRARFGRSATQIPALFEIAMMAAVANKALAEGKNEAHVSYLQKAILDSPGLIEIQSILREALHNGTNVDCQELLFGKLELLQASSSQQSSQAMPERPLTG